MSKCQKAETENTVYSPSPTKVEADNGTASAEENNSTQNKKHLRVLRTDEVIFREDLYPRIETSAVIVQKYAEDLEVLPPIEVNQHNELIDGWHRWTASGLEVSFGVAFPNTCPPSLQNLHAGTVKDGVFVPAGSVARYFFFLERENRSSKDCCQDVYFVQSVHGGPIKIGVAKNVTVRLNELQAAHPYELKVLAVLRGAGREKEQELHRQFAEHRLCGEWFEVSTRLLEVIQNA